MKRARGLAGIDILTIIVLVAIAAVLAIQRSGYVQNPIRVAQNRENMRAIEYAEILYEIEHMAEMVWSAGEDEGELDGDEELMDEMLEDEPLDDQMGVGESGAETSGAAVPEMIERGLSELAPYLLDWESVRSPFDGSPYSLMVKEFGYEIRSSASDEFIDSGVYSWEEPEEAEPFVSAVPAVPAAPDSGVPDVDSTSQEEAEI
ncbi:MAG: hypothetical protein CME06_09460 [Gemmatimonadetes bacterium]|nr:hypothetical protein [Gemmatimonadota bacterium]